MGVGVQGDEIVRPELCHAKRAGADRDKIGFGTFRSPGAGAIRELRLLQDRRCGTDEGAVGIGFGDAEGDLHGQVVDRLDLGHLVKLRQLRTAAGSFAAVLGGKHHIGGRHRASVRPQEAITQLPCNGLQVSRHTAIPHRWHRRGQPGSKGSRLVEPGKRFQDHRRGLVILRTARQIRIEDRRGLPVNDADMAVTSPLGRRSAGYE